ncbi:hypothetical protein FE257_001360 [Aspergillus nanangensis]|uniref:Xaa-Pro aminopeptidase n=1 Tax=Aspergillus nanangensis TaxID=2582783 RepID=A0AAD4GPN7_ASPNN|nr:hypothetical protein FE257_001360 [Aspergillus nanangensis]
MRVSAAEDWFYPADKCQIRLEITGNDGDKYPAKQHARRAAVKLDSPGLIYLAGQPTINWGDSDQPRTFRQRRYFYYLSGVDEPDCYLTYDIHTDLLTLYVPDFDLRHAIWMGPTLTLDEARHRYDVDRVRYFSCLTGDVESWVDKHSQSSPIYILHDAQRPCLPRKDVFLDNQQLIPAMDAARMIKDEYEIRMIRQANQISGLAHRKVLENIHTMTNETEIEAIFLATCVAHGAKNQSYEIIAGSGKNAATLHYVKNNEPLDGRQLVCLDAGAEWNCYSSDVTRTIPLATDWPSEYARNIYHLVQEMQETCISHIQKGVTMKSLQDTAHMIAIRGLQNLGVLTEGDAADIFHSGASAVFFPHGLGHHVGLEVHDVSAQSNTALREARSFVPLAVQSTPALDEGMVITIEPGIYFSDLAIANARQLPLAKYINFDEAVKYIPIGGVRIEDDILVTASGYENLTTAPKGEEMLEIIRWSIDD